MDIRREPRSHTGGGGSLALLKPCQLRRRAALRQQPLAVAVHHRGALPAPSLQDRRHRDGRHSHPEDGRPVPVRRRSESRQALSGARVGRVAGAGSAFPLVVGSSIAVAHAHGGRVLSGTGRTTPGQRTLHALEAS